MGKSTICIGENKGADQRHCFRYLDSTIPLLLKSEISSFWLFSVLVQVGLCQTCSETTLLVFPRGGSSVSLATLSAETKIYLLINVKMPVKWHFKMYKQEKIQTLVI